jgi:hypothetical protein
MTRAISSAPPLFPGTTKRTGWLGSQPAAFDGEAGAPAATAKPNANKAPLRKDVRLMPLNLVVDALFGYINKKAGATKMWRLQSK